MATNPISTTCTACGSGRAMPMRTPVKARVVPDVIKVKAPIVRKTFKR